MNAIEKANYDAQVLGGYTTGFMYDRLAKIDPLGAMEVLWMDRRWWQALGKAREWVGEKIRMCVGCGVALKWNEQPDMEGRHNLRRNGEQVGCGSDIIEYEGQWLIEWHRYIDHLSEGKDAESFFKSLL
jgi:hypothetical protein